MKRSVRDAITRALRSKALRAAIAALLAKLVQKLTNGGKHGT